MAFEKFLETIAENSYYPLAHHDPECPCLGAHEAVLTHMVTLAYSGLLLEAMQMASLIALTSKAKFHQFDGHPDRPCDAADSTYQYYLRSIAAV